MDIDDDYYGYAEESTSAERDIAAKEKKKQEEQSVITARLDYYENSTHGVWVHMNDDIYLSYIALLSAINTPIDDRGHYKNGKDEAENFRKALKYEAYLFGRKPSSHKEALKKKTMEMLFDIDHLEDLAALVPVFGNFYKYAMVVGQTTFSGIKYMRQQKRRKDTLKKLKKHKVSPYSLWLLKNPQTSKFTQCKEWDHPYRLTQQYFDNKYKTVATPKVAGKLDEYNYYDTVVGTKYNSRYQNRLLQRFKQ